MGYFFLVMGVPLVPTILLMLWYNHKRKEIEKGILAQTQVGQY